MDGNVIVITGQTATGKTGLALQLASEFPVELISADARQVYKGMDIGTGKIGRGDMLTKKPDEDWYLNDVRIHGINLISPDDTFSSMQFALYAQTKIEEIKARKHIPIIVGGTAFYITSLLQPQADQIVPPNPTLREGWRAKEQQSTLKEFVTQLQSELAQLDSTRLAAMNESDRGNPRRLMRAIEIAHAARNDHQLTSNHNQASENTPPLIVLHTDLVTLEKKISNRVSEMISLGLESEVKYLVDIYGWDVPGLQTIGYYEWQSYIEGRSTLADTAAAIITHNRQYARKQTMFLKRLEQTSWYDISEPTQTEDVYNTCRTILKKATIHI